MNEVEDPALVMAQSRIGRVLKDKWHIDRLIGMGGMAAVYEATHRNRSRVAVKMLHSPLSLDGDIRQRFLREGYVGNSVDHEGVVKVLDDDVDDDGSAFLVLELLEGEPLDTIWEREGRRMEPEQVIPFLVQMLDILAAAHAKGVVHRDIKPENIFVTQRHGVKVLDFGIARLREASDKGGAGLTRTGSTMGTPLFMSPEQARGRWEQVDERTDIWAVGATAYTLLSGHWVHEAETWNETLISAATRPAPSLAAVAPSAPSELVRVVDRSLAFDKEDRWANAHAMQEALLALMEHPGAAEGPIFSSKQGHFPARLASSSAHTIVAPVVAQSTFSSSTRSSKIEIPAVKRSSRWRHLTWVGALLCLALIGAFFALTGDAVSLFHASPVTPITSSSTTVVETPSPSSSAPESTANSADPPASIPDDDIVEVPAKTTKNVGETGGLKSSSVPPNPRSVPVPPPPAKSKSKPPPAAFPHIKRHYR